jgi:hypothetical protein
MWRSYLLKRKSKKETMKKILLFTILTICSVSAFAQQPSLDTIQIRGTIIVKGQIENKQVFRMYQDTSYYKQRLQKNLHTRWFVFDLGFNNFRDKSDYLQAKALSLYRPSTSNSFIATGPVRELQYDYSAYALNYLAPREDDQTLSMSEFKIIPSKSINFNVWLFQQKLNIHKHYVNLIYAFGMEVNGYRYARDISYQPGYPTVIVRDSVSYSKNKITAQYLSVPLMVNFMSNPARPNRSVKFSAGVQGGYLLSSRTKQVSREYGKIRRTDDFNLNKWKVGLTGEVGYGAFKIYGNFALTPLHEYGLEQYPFAFGIRLNGF